MKPNDYVIIKRGDYFVFVLRDEFTTGVYTCDKNGKIIFPGNRLLVTHLTPEENFVKYRHIVGKMNVKPERFIGDGSAPGTYFGPIEPRVCHKMEVIDELKRYDDEEESERIYACDESYMSIDGSNIDHMYTCRARFHNLVEAFQEWGMVSKKITDIVNPEPEDIMWTIDQLKSYPGKLIVNREMKDVGYAIVELLSIHSDDGIVYEDEFMGEGECDEFLEFIGLLKKEVPEFKGFTTPDPFEGIDILELLRTAKSEGNINFDIDSISKVEIKG